MLTATSPQLGKDARQQTERAGLTLERSKTNLTGFVGVSKTTAGRYMARGRYLNKYVHLGTYDTPEEAALQYTYWRKYKDEVEEIDIDGIMFRCC